MSLLRCNTTLAPSALQPPAFLDCWTKLSTSLTSEKVEQDVFEHCFVDLRVGDGVQQLPLLLAGENELTQLLPVDLPVLQEDLGAEVVHDAGIGGGVRLHNCSRQREEQISHLQLL